MPLNVDGWCEVVLQLTDGVGETHNLLEKMWLAGGVLHSTNYFGNSGPEYQGSLNKDGSFKLTWTRGDADGEKQAISGIINADGEHISATWDSIFLVGCVLHLKSDEVALLVRR